MAFVEVGADERRVAIGGERNAASKAAACGLFFATRELRALLGPGRSRAREDPGGANLHAARFIVDATDERGVAVGGQRDADAELGLAVAVRWHQLRSLLGPCRADAREDPGGARKRVVFGAANEHRVAVGRERNARSELRRRRDVARGELFALLDQRVDPHREVRSMRVDLQQQIVAAQRHPSVQRVPPRVHRGEL